MLDSYSGGPLDDYHQSLAENVYSLSNILSASYFSPTNEYAIKEDPTFGYGICAER